MVKLSKSHWPFRGWMEATGCCGTLRCQPEYHNPNCGSPTGMGPGIHMTWRIGQEVGDQVSPDRVDRSICLATEESAHYCTQSTNALSLTSWQAGVCTDHQEPTTCFPVEIPENCPEASPNSWSNNWVNWWPVLSVRCGSLLALRDFSKFILDLTSPLWAVSFVVIMILENNKWHMKGNWYTYKIVQSAYL